MNDSEIAESLWLIPCKTMKDVASGNDEEIIGKFEQNDKEFSEKFLQNGVLISNEQVIHKDDHHIYK